MQAIETLRAEHNGVLTVLTQLERAATATAQGAPIPAAIFRDIQEFFAIFVDQCHHGKEDAEVFPRLTDAAGRDLTRRLEEEHATGRRLAAAYATAVRDYTPGERHSGARLAGAARAYAAFLRAHIALEDRELFPAMARHLSAEDRTLTAAFDRLEEEQIGPGTHERLHGMIDGLAARIAPYVVTAGT